MTIKEARKILDEIAVGLTDIEVQEIIDWLNKFADVFIEIVETDSLKEKAAYTPAYITGNGC
jgi:hypothetical protein